MFLADEYDSFVIDLDGVLYRGDEPIPAAGEAIDRLRSSGKGIAFVTNNSSRTPEEVAEKLTKLGVKASSEEVVTSALATASLLAKRGGGSAFVIGETGVRKALLNAGVEIREGEPESVDYVVVGWDRGVDYAKLRRASLLVQRGARLVATNSDASYPAPDGLWPGAGAILAAVTTTTRTTAEVVGKPHAPLFHEARERAGEGRALSVGDRLDTDVAGAAALGWDSLLVFSGVTRPPDLIRTAVLPTFIGKDLAALWTESTRIRRASAEDIAAIENLLRDADLTEGGVPDRLSDTFVADGATGLVGTVSIERVGELGHLRALAVPRDHRGNGVGTILAAHAVTAARADGVHQLFAVTETAEGFFIRLGFHRLGSKDALPGPLRDTVWDCCDSRAVVLQLRL